MGESASPTLCGIRKLEPREIASLVPFARNSRTHSEAQIAQIAASIREFGWTNPLLIDEDGGIIAGHGRLLAARQLGHSDVPCIVLDGLTNAQKRSDWPHSPWRAIGALCLNRSISCPAYSGIS